MQLLAPVLTIVVSVGLGCLLALAPGGSRRVGGLIRTFAVAAALGVVVLHLVPHALHRVGLAGLLVAVAAYLATPLIESGVARAVRAGGASVDLRLEAAFAALLVHRIGDGAAMAVGQRHGIALLLALGAHSVPVVTFVVMAFGQSRGLRHGLGRAGGMALASGVGVVLIEAIPSLTVGAAGGYVDAVVAGTLLHVVAHELRTDPPQGVGTKLVDFLAAITGVAVCLLPELLMHSGHEHVAHAHGDVGTAELAHSALELSLEMAPFLLLGLLLAALLQSLSVRFPPGATHRRGLVASALRGSVLSAPIPLCSCSVVSISRSLGAGGAAPALVGAFLVATPELGIETLLVSGQLLGWPLAAARLGGALVVAIGAGLAVGMIARRTSSSTGSASIEHLAHVAPSGSFAGRYAHALDELVVHVGGWLALGIALAVYLERLVPAEAFAGLDAPVVQLAGLTAVALPAYVCAPAATPVAAVLIAKGLGPGPVLAGVLLGSTLNYVGMRLLREMYGWGAVLVGALAAVVLAWAVGLGVGATGVSAPIAAAAAHGHARGGGAESIAWVALGILIVLGLRTSWQVGIRAWLANVFEPRHEGHAHVHVHAHCADSMSAQGHEWEQWHAHERPDPSHRHD